MVQELNEDAEGHVPWEPRCLLPRTGPRVTSVLAGVALGHRCVLLCGQIQKHEGGEGG